MNYEDRDYKFTDEQVRELGFSSYEELERYYDILGDERIINKNQCVSQISNVHFEDRLSLPRKERLERSIQDFVDIFLSWDVNNNVPSFEDLAMSKSWLDRRLGIYYNFMARELKKVYEEDTQSEFQR